MFYYFESPLIKVGDSETRKGLGGPKQRDGACLGGAALAPWKSGKRGRGAGSGLSPGQAAHCKSHGDP